jgi:hypothetical protein
MPPDQSDQCKHDAAQNSIAALTCAGARAFRTSPGKVRRSRSHVAASPLRAEAPQRLRGVSAAAQGGGAAGARTTWAHSALDAAAAEKRHKKDSPHEARPRAASCSSRAVQSLSRVRGFVDPVSQPPAASSTLCLSRLRLRRPCVSAACGFVDPVSQPPAASSTLCLSRGRLRRPCVSAAGGFVDPVSQPRAASSTLCLSRGRLRRRP